MEPMHHLGVAVNRGGLILISGNENSGGGGLDGVHGDHRLPALVGSLCKVPPPSA